MAATPKIALIPPLPTSDIMQKSMNSDGYQMHPAWKQWFSIVSTTLQDHLSPEGTLIPSVNTDQLNVLNTPDSIGKIIYDSDAGVLKVNNDGTFKEIATVP